MLTYKKKKTGNGRVEYSHKTNQMISLIYRHKHMNQIRIAPRMVTTSYKQLR